MAEQIISPGVFQFENDQSVVAQGIQVIGGALVGPTVNGSPLVPTLVTSLQQFQQIFGTTFNSGSNYYEYFTSLAAQQYFQNGGNTLYITRIISGSNNVSTYAQSPIAASGSLLSGSIGTGSAFTASFTLETLAWGDGQNSSGSEVSGALANGTANNLRWQIGNVNYANGTFTLLIRQGNDTNINPNILETWSGLSLDPMQPNYISRVIGDLKNVYAVDSDNIPLITTTGSFNNVSQFVRVASVNAPNINSIDNNGNFKSGSFATTLPINGTSGSFSGGVAATNQVQLMNEQITDTNIQGFSPNDYITAFNLLQNKDAYKFNLLLAPGISLTNAAVSSFIALCQNREDAIAIVDTGKFGTAISQAVQNATSQQTNYAATYYPWIQTQSSGLGKAVWVPPSVMMGGVFAFNDQVSAEWFAPAGLNRGGIAGAIKAERRLSQGDRDNLYGGNVNPLATFPQSGIVAWGQKTLQKQQTALDRVNVRRLLINLKNFIGQVSMNLVFEQNTTATRNRFLAQVNPYLDSVVQKQGLFAYKTTMDATNNTPDVIDRNQLVGTIQLQPTKTAEFIILNFNILPTGATFS